MFSKKHCKRREYINAMHPLQRARQKLAQEERARRKRLAQDMELQAMAANGLLPTDFAFTVDVRPLDEDDDVPLLPHLFCWCRLPCRTMRNPGRRCASAG